MGRPHSFKRPSARRRIGRKIIIVCEGKKTEYNYFDAIRRSMRLPTLQIEVVHPDATDPLNIVQAAIALRHDRTCDKIWSREDTAWAVFDGDEHKEANRDNWNRAIQIANNNSIHLAISNPCFELWYLLHYQNQMAGLTRTEARRLLRRHIKDYDKPMILWPDPLKAVTSEAINRASRLAERALADGEDNHCNPST